MELILSQDKIVNVLDSTCWYVSTFFFLSNFQMGLNFKALISSHLYDLAHVPIKIYLWYPSHKSCFVVWMDWKIFFIKKLNLDGNLLVAKTPLIRRNINGLGRVCVSVSHSKRNLDRKSFRSLSSYLFILEFIGIECMG